MKLHLLHKGEGCHRHWDFQPRFHLCLIIILHHIHSWSQVMVPNPWHPPLGRSFQTLPFSLPAVRNLNSPSPTVGWSRRISSSKVLFTTTLWKGSSSIMKVSKHQTRALSLHRFLQRLTTMETSHLKSWSSGNLQTTDSTVHLMRVTLSSKDLRTCFLQHHWISLCHKPRASQILNELWRQTEV